MNGLPSSFDPSLASDGRDLVVDLPRREPGAARANGVGLQSLHCAEETHFPERRADFVKLSLNDRKNQGNGPTPVTQHRRIVCALVQEHLWIGHEGVYLDRSHAPPPVR